MDILMCLVMFVFISLATVIADDYGLYADILNSALLKCSFDKTKILNMDLLKIYTYDFANDVNTSHYLNEPIDFILAGVDPTRPINIFIPGYTESINNRHVEDVRQNLKYYTQAYLFVIDHHEYTYKKKLNQRSSYERSVTYYWSIGRAIALFLKDIFTRGIDIRKVTILGHSLGSQIAGAVGEVFINETGKMLPRIRGSDPAGPCFSKSATEYQLRAGLAEYVETYHCNAGVLGTNRDLADAVFYVNGGKAQPGCKTPTGFKSEVLILKDLKAASCNHNTCPIVLTLPAKVSGIWEATACDSEENYSTGACYGDATTIAGLFSSMFNRGIYYFNTIGYDTTP